MQNIESNCYELELKLIFVYKVLVLHVSCTKLRNYWIVFFLGRLFQTQGNLGILFSIFSLEVFTPGLLATPASSHLSRSRDTQCLHLQLLPLSRFHCRQSSLEQRGSAGSVASCCAVFFPSAPSRA